MPPARQGRNKPFRIGIWCAFPSTELPPEGSGVCPHHFAAGLVQGEELEVILFVRPEDTHHAAALQSRSDGRVHVVPQVEADSALPRWLLFLLRHAGPWLAAYAAKKQMAGKGIRRFGGRIVKHLSGLFSSAWFRVRKSPMTGWPLLMLSGFLATFVFLVYWPFYALKQFIDAGRQCVFLPWLLLYRVDGFRRRWQLLRVGLNPLCLAREEDCDVWLIPTLLFPHSLKGLDTPTIIVLPFQPPPEELRKVAECRAAEATLCVSTSSDRQWSKLCQVDPAKIRQVSPFPVTNSYQLEPELRQGTLREAASDWLKVFQEAVVECQWQSDLDLAHSIRRWWRFFSFFVLRKFSLPQLVRPWPRLETLPVHPSDRLRAFLFLPVNYLGGVLQVTKELAAELATVNRERQQLDLALGLLEEQRNIDNIAHLGNEVPIHRMRIQQITRTGIVRMIGETPRWLASRPEPRFCFMSGTEQVAFQADAWFSMIDRFPLPLLPARPLGIIVQDVLQRRYSEFFEPSFFNVQASAIIPTCRAAEVIVTMTPQTKDDVIAEYGLEPSRVRLLPVACNPHWHFGGVEPETVPGIRQPFILNVANSNPHKGGTFLLRAFHQLRQGLRNGSPQLVLCGVNTQAFAPGPNHPDDQPYWRSVRHLVKELGLQVGRDVVFLGSVSDQQLCYLMQNCSVVVNAALYDNGCLSLAEGAYFGKPVVSTRYPAAEFHAHRFGYQPFFFPVGDVEAFAAVLRAALARSPASEAEIQRAQAHFLDPEFSFRRYAERLYDVLVELAEKGRRQRNDLGPFRLYAA